MTKEDMRKLENKKVEVEFEGKSIKGIVETAFTQMPGLMIRKESGGLSLVAVNTITDLKEC